MANNCWYNMVAVAPKKETLERLIRIMNYEDNEYFIYRCFSVSQNNEIIFDKKNNLYSVNLQGDVAWSCDMWFDGKENKDELIIIGREKDDHSKLIYGTAHYITLDLLCQKLDFGLEVFAEESGCEFQEHHTVNHNGEHYDESADWREEWCDEDGNELDEPISIGGLENYLNFDTCEMIYG